MKRILCLALLSFTASLAAAENPYDFRASVAYGQLSAADKERLEQVRHDQVLLWGALDIYADEHNGNPPATLDELIPKYLTELPSDPFGTQQTAAAQETGGYTRSKGGFGYHFRRGAPRNRAWVIASVGLPDFPYLAERGNVGLYICNGTWISGVNPAVGHAFHAQPDGAANGSQPFSRETNRTSSAAGSRR
jgi:hypothetical protein